MKFKYQSFNFAAPTLQVIEQANQIIREYMDDGFVLTLRQLYYQFVARDLMANSQRNYKRLGTIISDGRLAGLIDWEAIEDRTRNLQINPHWEDPAHIIHSAAAGYRIDLWADQPYRVEVWIEKEALAGVVEKPCRDLDVPFFSCRGYVSQSEQRKAGVRFLTYRRNNQPVILLHLGDHDPSGIDMTRDNGDRLDMFSRYSGAVEVERIALNMDQIDELDPPPNPAKLTDSRATDYIARFGHNSWELDALEPRYLDRLIRAKVEHYMDRTRMDAMIERQEAERQRLYEIASSLEDWDNG